MDIKDLELRMDFKRVGERPDGLMNDLPNHWRIHLHRNGIYRRFYYSTGSGWEGTPEMFDVLDCLLGDYTLTMRYTEFCDEFGYDEDSRTAEKIFKETMKNTEKIDDLFSDWDMETLQIEVSNMQRGK